MKSIREVFEVLDITISDNDLVVVKFGRGDTYLVIKNSEPCEVLNNKFLNSGSIISKHLVSRLLLDSKRPLVLNDDIVDIDKAIQYCHNLVLYGSMGK